MTTKSSAKDSVCHWSRRRNRWHTDQPVVGQFELKIRIRVYFTRFANNVNTKTDISHHAKRHQTSDVLCRCDFTPKQNPADCRENAQSNLQRCRYAERSQLRRNRYNETRKSIAPPIIKPIPQSIAMIAWIGGLLLFDMSRYAFKGCKSEVALPFLRSTRRDR